MAYGDYGGFAYRQGELVPERSDVYLLDAANAAPFGMWSREAVKQAASAPEHHVLLGDGPIYLSLYKQNTVTLYRLGEEVPILSLVGLEWRASYSTVEEEYIDTDYGEEKGVPLEFDIDGHHVTIWFVYTNNYFTFAQVEQPDGVIWNGFSGYGVGAGFDDEDDSPNPCRLETELWERFGRPNAAALAAQIFRHNGASDSDVENLNEEE